MSCLHKVFLVIAIILCPKYFALSQSYADIGKLLIERKFMQAESLLTERLKKSPDDDSAHYYIGQIIVRSRTVDRYDEAIEHLKYCVSSKPNASNYHLWLGRAYGVKAQNAGAFSAIAFIDDIKTEYLRAIVLDPGNFDARYDLIQFYLQTPGILGGSNSKAREIAQEYENAYPKLAPLLRAAIDIYDGDFDKGYANAMAVTTPVDDILLGYYRNTLLFIGFSFLDNNEPKRAGGVFRKFVENFPMLAVGYHGLGRSYLEAGNTNDAITSFEKAISLENTIGSQYRLGLACERKGDREKAINCFEEFLLLKFQLDQKFIKDASEHLNDLKAKVQ